MKQMTPIEKTIRGNTFYIRPFPAFRASNISGQLATLVAPMVSGLAPIVAALDGGTDSEGSSEQSVMDLDVEKAAPALAGAFSSISGDKAERLLRQLLIDSQNISVVPKGEATARLLTQDIADEIFCCEVQDMYVLAYEVIQLNFKGFFKKLGTQFGTVFEKLKGAPSMENMANLIVASSAN